MLRHWGFEARPHSMAGEHTDHCANLVAYGKSKLIYRKENNKEIMIKKSIIYLMRLSVQISCL